MVGKTPSEQAISYFPPTMDFKVCTIAQHKYTVHICYVLIFNRWRQYVLKLECHFRHNYYLEVDL